MKTVKHLATLAVALCLFSACADNSPNPNYEVANCGVIKDPLQDITVLKAIMEDVVKNRKSCTIKKFNYRNEFLYQVEIIAPDSGPSFINCQGKILGSCGMGACSDDYKKILQEVKNPVVLFKQK
jgi:hypothetical protein